MRLPDKTMLEKMKVVTNWAKYISGEMKKKIKCINVKRSGMNSGMRLAAASALF